MAALCPSSEAAGPILPLREVGADDLSRIGPKAYHLGLLARAGFPVADGFCITTDALAGLNSQDARLPEWLADAVIDAYRRSRFGLVAVRSSALDEDRPEASGAGVYASTLNVGDEKALIEAVEACLRSRHHQVARLYRRCCAGRPPAMAVLVQAQVDAEAAGVMFTADPITRRAGKVHLNAVWGLGEPLASGRVSGDLFVAAANGRLRSRRIAPKTTMLTGRGEQPVPPEKAGQPALSPAQIGDLVRLGQAVEAKFGRPQDIEFAIDRGQPILIQARPIPEPETRGEDEAMDAYLASERRRLAGHLDELKRRGRLRCSEAVLSNGNIGELLPAPTPMSFGLFRHIFAGVGGAIPRGRRRLGYGVDDGCAENLFELVCGQPYFNLEIDARCYDIGLPLDLEGVLAEVASRPEAANYPELDLYGRKLDAADAPGREEHRGDFHARLLGCGMRFAARCHRSLLPALEARRRQDQDSVVPEASAEQLLEAFQARLDRLRRRIGIPFVMAARLGFYFADQVKQRLGRLLGAEAEEWYPFLLQGLPGSRITQQAMDLERLACGQIEAAQFLAAYGSLASNELELSLPRLQENQDLLDRLLADLIRSGRSPRAEFARQKAQREEWEKRLAEKLGEGSEAAALFADLAVAQSCLPLRETIKFHLAAEYARLRQLLQHIESRLECPPESLYFLYPEELRMCLESSTWQGLVDGRRRERRLAQRLLAQKRMPAVLFGSRLEAMGRLPSCAAAQVHGGVPVSPGEVVGPVRWVDADAVDVSRLLADFRGGEILVARSANLGLSPLFRVAAGLVVEVGGVLAHSACQAREAGIPAVVLDNASCILKDGDMVRINGSKGSIELLQRAGVEECP